jgi:hypothetical protein
MLKSINHAKLLYKFMIEKQHRLSGENKCKENRGKEWHAFFLQVEGYFTEESIVNMFRHIRIGYYVYVKINSIKKLNRKGNTTVLI